MGTLFPPLIFITGEEMFMESIFAFGQTAKLSLKA
jgi:hypothetical protein